eukprot:gene3343-8491_t
MPLAAAMCSGRRVLGCLGRDAAARGGGQSGSRCARRPKSHCHPLQASLRTLGHPAQTCPRGVCSNASLHFALRCAAGVDTLDDCDGVGLATELFEVGDTAVAPAPLPVAALPPPVFPRAQLNAGAADIEGFDVAEWERLALASLRKKTADADRVATVRVLTLCRVASAAAAGGITPTLRADAGACRSVAPPAASARARRAGLSAGCDAGGCVVVVEAELRTADASDAALAAEAVRALRRAVDDPESEIRRHGGVVAGGVVGTPELPPPAPTPARRICFVYS